MGLAMDRPLRVTVAGAGTMGHGLALVMARAGHEVRLLDVDDKMLAQAERLIRKQLDFLRDSGEAPERSPADSINRIHFATGLDAARDSDLVLESITENPEIKRRFYSEIAAITGPDTLISSNTSYLNIFELAPPDIQRRLMISHFFAPPYLIPLVEIAKGPQTDPAHVAFMQELLTRAGQKPIVLDQFIPGFIVNRLQRALAREIFFLLDGGYAKPEVIDRAVLASLGIRLPVLGVVRRYDFAGLDFSLNVFRNPSIHLSSDDRPPECLKELVARNHLGVKTGRGFYDYEGLSLDEVYHKRDKLLLRMRRLLAEIEQEFWEK